MVYFSIYFSTIHLLREFIDLVKIFYAIILSLLLPQIELIFYDEHFRSSNECFLLLEERNWISIPMYKIPTNSIPIN